MGEGSRFETYKKKTQKHRPVETTTLFITKSLLLVISISLLIAAGMEYPYINPKKTIPSLCFAVCLLLLTLEYPKFLVRLINRVPIVNIRIRVYRQLV